MNTCYCLLNHEITENQATELKSKYGIKKIIYPDDVINTMWAQLPATTSIDMNIIKVILSWMKEIKKGDVLVVQGESGFTFSIVDWALSNNIIALHAVSERRETEIVQGEKIIKRHEFCHICFRPYIRI